MADVTDSSLRCAHIPLLSNILLTMAPGCAAFAAKLVCYHDVLLAVTELQAQRPAPMQILRRIGRSDKSGELLVGRGAWFASLVLCDSFQIW
jgi:hypothetical protein